MSDSTVRESNLAQKYKTPGACTTVMIRNIPSKYTQAELIAEVVESLGGQGHTLFDFFYLPWDTTHNANVGYAFINFKDAASAQLASQAFTNYVFKNHDSRKVAKLVPAHIQGLENNLRHLQDRAVVHSGHPCVPVVVWNGVTLELSKVFDELRRAQARKSSMAFAGNEHRHGHAGDQINDFCQMMDRVAGIRTSRQDGPADGMLHSLLDAQSSRAGWHAALASSPPVMSGGNIDDRHRRRAADDAALLTGRAPASLTLTEPPMNIARNAPAHMSAPGRLSGFPNEEEPAPFAKMNNVDSVEIVFDTTKDDILRRFLVGETSEQHPARGVEHMHF